jgi:hypothetical protein
MPLKRSPSEGERNITIALNDSEIELLTRLGRYSRTDFVDYVCSCPDEVKAMAQAELEAVVKKAAPVEAQQLARLILVELLRGCGALHTKTETPRFVECIIAFSAFYSGPQVIPPTDGKRTSITVPLSRAERAALNKVAAQIAARIADERSRPSILARFAIITAAQRCEACLSESKAARELAAGGTQQSPPGSPNDQSDNA